jgi:hypothetical protein
MLTNQSIIFDDNGTNVDLSMSLNKFRTGTQVIDLVAAEDALYIGSDLPFNHRHIDVQVPNDQASIASVQLWNGSDWKDVALTADFTESGGITLAQSGLISWIPDRNESWSPEQDSEDVDGLTIEGVYDYYWAKITFNNDLNSLTELKFIGHLFSNDDVLFDYMPDLNNTALMDSFELPAGTKTDWLDQHYAAAEAIIREIRSSGVIKSANQILKPTNFETPSVYKTAELIFQGLGNSYRDDRDDARKLYKEAMKMTFYDVDENANANLDKKEKKKSMRYFTR